MFPPPEWQMMTSLGRVLKRRGYCRVGLVGLKVRYEERHGFIINRTAWHGPRRLMLEIESTHEIDPETGRRRKLIVEADHCAHAETWPVCCCWPRDDDRANQWPNVPDHPLEAVILAALWKRPGLDVATIGTVLRGSTDRDEASGGYEVVAADALRVLHHYGVVDRDRAGLYSLAQPNCPIERAEVAALVASGEVRA